jgi:hypothetical protein
MRKLGIEPLAPAAGRHRAGREDFAEAALSRQVDFEAQAHWRRICAPLI